MPDDKRVQDLMVPVEDYPHVPCWFTLRQAMAIVREAALKLECPFEPRGVLVFDEKYQLVGILTLRDIIEGLEPTFQHEPASVMVEPNRGVRLADLFGPGLQAASQKLVSEVMHSVKVTIQGNDNLAKALFLMITENLFRVPVIQDDKVVGILRLVELFNQISDLVIDDNDQNAPISPTH